MNSQIAFIQEQQTLAIVEALQILWRPAAVHDLNDKVSLFNLVLSAADSLAFHEVEGFACTGGVNQPNRDATNIDHFFDRVSRGAGQFADNRSIISEQEVQQTRLTDIRRSVNNGPQPVPKHPTLVSR